MENAIAAASRNIDALSPYEFWAAVAITTAITLYVFWRMAVSFHHARLIENIPTARIRSAPQGYVELTGTAHPMDDQPVASPVSGTRCVWFHYRIEQKTDSYDQRGQLRSRWRVIRQQISDDLFVLRDQTGECLIDPDGANVISNDTRVWYERHRTPVLRYTETLIRPGEPLYAMGLFKATRSHHDPQFREQISLMLRQWKQDPDVLLSRYDRDEDGEISLAEWQHARRDAYIKVNEKLSRQTEALNMMQGSTLRNQPYILSTVPEQQLVARYRRRGAGALLLFMVLGALVVWAINQRLGGG